MVSAGNNFSGKKDILCLYFICDVYFSGEELYLFKGERDLLVECWNGLFY